MSDVKPVNFPDYLNENHLQKCYKYQYREKFTELLLYILSFTVALAIASAIDTGITKYMNEDSFISHIIYAIVIFIIALIATWLIIRYIMPKYDCSNYKFD